MEQSTDRGTVRLVIVLIGVLALATVGAVIYLAATGSSAAEAGSVHDLAIALVACLITLATTRSRPNDAPEVYKDTVKTVRAPTPDQVAAETTHEDVTTWTRA